MVAPHARRALLTLATLACSLTLGGCVAPSKGGPGDGPGGPTSGSDSGSGRTAPGWVENVPTDAAYLYAVGICPPTWGGLEDQRQQAAARARAAIARAIRTEIKATSLMSESEGGGGGATESSYSMESNVLADTEALVEKCEETSMWTDQSGSMGFPRTIYVLVRCPRSEVFKR